MATNIGNLAVQVTGSTTGLTQALKTGEKDVQQFAKKTEKHSADIGKGMFGGMGKMLAVATGAGAGLFAGFSLAEMVVDSVKLAAGMDDVATSFQTMLGDADAGKKLFDEIKEAGDDMRMSIVPVAEGAKALFAAGVEDNQLVPTLKLLGDLAMGDSTKLVGLAEAYGRVKETGEVTGKTLRTMGGMGLWSQLAKGMGVDNAELKEMLEAGKVGFGDLQDAMVSATSAGGIFFGATQRRMDTLSGQLDRLKDHWEDFKISFGGVLIEEFGLKDFVSKLSDALEKGKDNMESIRPIVREVADAFKEASVDAFKFAMALGEAVAQVADLTKGPSWKGTAKAAVMPFSGMSSAAAKFSLSDTEGPAATQFAKFKSSLEKIFEIGGKAGASGGAGVGTSGGPTTIAITALTELARTTDLVTNAQRKQVDAIVANMEPFEELRKTMRELSEISGRGGFKGREGAFESGIAQAFRKSFGSQLNQPAMIAAPALKDSAEALQKIAEFEVNGSKQNIEAEIKNILEDALRTQKETLEEDKKIARALGNNIIAIFQKKLPN